MKTEDVLEDKIFTKTAFAVRIDTLEAGIRWERQMREEKDRELVAMSAQFHGLANSMRSLAAVSETEAGEFWQVLMKYLPAGFAVSAASGQDRVFRHALTQALKVFTMSRIGGGANGGTT